MAMGENKCYRCGVAITSQNGRSVAVTTSESRVSAFCDMCEEEVFTQLKEQHGLHLALYYACLKFDVPCEPTVVPTDADNQYSWGEYLDALGEHGKYEMNGNPRCFNDGVYNIFRIFGQGMTEKDFAKHVQYEQAKQEKLAGTPEQRERWGVKIGFTNADYDELDRLYNTRLASYKGVTITPQMEYTLRQVSLWTCTMNAYVESGNIAGAKNLQVMCDTALGSESMRKKDEKPLENFRVDALIKAMEDDGIMNDGGFVGYTEMLDNIGKSFLKKRKYDYTIDVCDQMIHSIVNTMRKNAGEEPLDELTDDMLVEDEFGEFAEEESVDEKKRKKYANLVPLRTPSKSKGD